MSYQTNIIYDTKENQNFRTVLFTGVHSQLVVMSIPPGGEIGMETHDYVEQTLFFLSGNGKAILDGKYSPVKEGDVLVVSPHTKHNVVNSGSTPLKIYTVYAPPNHLDGRIHATKKEADLDVEDETFGETRIVAGGISNRSIQQRNNEASTLQNQECQLTTQAGIRGIREPDLKPGFIPDIGHNPLPNSPLENPEEPMPTIFALK